MLASAVGAEHRCLTSVCSVSQLGQRNAPAFPAPRLLLPKPWFAGPLRVPSTQDRLVGIEIRTIAPAPDSPIAGHNSGVAAGRPRMASPRMGWGIGVPEHDQSSGGAFPVAVASGKAVEVSALLFPSELHELQLRRCSTAHRRVMAELAFSPPPGAGPNLPALALL